LNDKSTVVNLLPWLPNNHTLVDMVKINSIISW
jgi:hypothetical protein